MAAAILLLVSANAWCAETNNPEDFKLRPPRAQIPPGFWEQNANWIVPLAIGALLAVALLIWYFATPKPLEPMAAEVRARRELEKLAAAPADRDVLSRTSQILKQYLAEVFGLRREEMTTAEFCAALTAKQEPGEELTRQVCQFLRRNDDMKFAPGPVPASNVPEALRLVQQTEARRAKLRAAQTQEAKGPNVPSVPAVQKS